MARAALARSALAAAEDSLAVLASDRYDLAGEPGPHRGGRRGAAGLAPLPDGAAGCCDYLAGSGSDAFMPKVEEVVGRSKGEIGANVAHRKVPEIGYSG